MRIVRAFCLLFVLTSCAGGGSSVDVDDTAPSTITDLRIRGVTPMTVTLEWTSPGENEDAGTAAAYDVRVSRAPIDYLNWDAAKTLAGEPAPHTAGSLDTMVVGGLEEDSTYYFALKTGDHAGQWSSVSNSAVATCFDNTVVIFADSHLDAAVRTAIAHPAGVLRRTDVQPLAFLDAQSLSIASLSGLEYCRNLETLFITNNAVTSLAPLAPLVKMRSLQASGNAIDDISPLAGLTRLEEVFLRGNDIVDISALAGKTGILRLTLAENEITSTDALAGMVLLTSLDLSGNQIASVAGLAGLTGLESLNLWRNQLVDVSPLAGLVNLKSLSLWSNDVVDVTPLAGLTKLEQLFLVDNAVGSIDAVSGMTALRELNLSQNPIVDLSPVAGLTALTDLQAQACKVVDVSALQSLVNLKTLVLNINEVVDISPLVDNPGLDAGDELYLYGNPLSDESVKTHVPALTARGVTVYY